NIKKQVQQLMFATEKDGNRVINEVQDALPKMFIQRLDTIDQQSKYKLVAKHLISPELIKRPAAAVLLNEDESLSIMVNEEDHIRIQAMGNDLSLQTLYERASALDDTLDSELDVS